MRTRNIKINIFLNEDENKILNEKVKKSGLNKSEFFRKIILDYKLKEQPDERFYEILSQLRGMATTKLWKFKSRLDRLIDYAINGEKTENKLYVSGINCMPFEMCISIGNLTSTEVLQKLEYSSYFDLLGIPLPDNVTRNIKLFTGRGIYKKE